MQTERVGRAASALFAVALSMAPAIAGAERNVVVARVAAPAAARETAGALGQTVGELVAQRYWIVDAGLLDDALDGRPVGKLGRDGFKQVANKIGVDALVVAELEPKRGGKPWVLHVEVIEGQSGRTVAKFDVTLAGRRLDDAGRSELGKKLTVIGETALVGTEGERERLTPGGARGLAAASKAPEAVRSLVSPETQEAAPVRAIRHRRDEGNLEGAFAATLRERSAARPLPSQVAKIHDAPDAAATEPMSAPGRDAAATEPMTAPAPAPATSIASNDIAAATAPVPMTTSASASAASREEEPRLLYRARPRGRLTDAPVIEVDLGLSVVKRDLAFSVADGTPSDAQPARYEGAAAASGVVDVGVYPLIVIAPRHTAWHGLGFGLGYESAFDLDTTVTLDGDAVELGTTQRRLALELRYRADLPFRLRPLVELSAGYGRLGLLIDDGGEDTGVPDLDYTLATAGLRARLPLSGRVALNLSGRYLHALDTGEFEEADEYGDTSAWGLELEAGIFVEPVRRVVVRAGARYTRMSLDIEGNGARAMTIPGSTTPNVTAASDEYLGGFVTAGYLF